MTRRRKRPNIFGWTVFGLVLLFGYYFESGVFTSQPNPFEATPTRDPFPGIICDGSEKLFKEGKLDSGHRALINRRSNASPQDPTLYIALARVQVFAGLPEDAQANAENAILLEPRIIRWLMPCAPGHWIFRMAKTVTQWRRLMKPLQIDPNNAIAHAYRVEILIDSGSI